MNTPSVLLIEDTQDIAELLSQGLKNIGMKVEIASTGHDALQYLNLKNEFDVILLDLMLPDIDGLDLLVKIKKLSEAPVIIISAKNSVSDRVRGIENGADDYLGKPLSIEELAVRIKAQLRKIGKEKKNSDDPVTIGEWILDPEQLQAFNESGRSANLTPSEYQLLETLVSNPNKIFTRDYLLSLREKDSLDVSDRAIDTQLSRIRTKLKITNGTEQVFQSIRGVGYKYNTSLVKNNNE